MRPAASVCIFISLAAFALSGCQATTVRKSANATFDWASVTKRVVFVEPDVELGSLQASGEVEPRADWTTSARFLMSGEISRTLSTKGIELVHADHLTDPHEVQLSKLHGAVGQAILLHLYTPNLKLPNKGDALDWSLGPGAVDFKKHYGADYALFVYVRDSYTSTGRALLMIGAAIFHVSVAGGQQIGFASLVDLRTGNIVWFNRIANSSGDLRTEEPARKVIANLLQDLPL